MDYLEKGKTINGQGYASELRQLVGAIKSKHEEKQRADVHLIQENTSFHTDQVAVTEAADSNFGLLLHLIHSSELASSDFFLFSKIKSHLHGHHFGNNDDIIYPVEEFFSRTRVPLCSVMELQCLSFIGPSISMSRGTILFL